MPFSPQKHQPQNITLLRNSSSVGENLWHAPDFKIIFFLLCPARQQKIEEIIEQEPLSTDHIEELSPYSNQYVIPHNQTNTKRYGMVLYSKHHRQGAEEEADNFKQALETAGCDVTKLEWTNTAELGSMIDSSLEGIVSSCSLLIVAVMTHGYRGALRGSENSEIPVNDILFQLQHTLPKNTPLVRSVNSSLTTMMLGMLVFGLL